MRPDEERNHEFNPLSFEENFMNENLQWQEVVVVLVLALVTSMENSGGKKESKTLPLFLLKDVNKPLKYRNSTTMS